MEEDYRLFKILKENRTMNCVDLSKNMRGKRNGFIYYTESFRIDFENKMSRLAYLEEENKELKNKNMELKNTYIKVAKHQDKLGHQELAEYMLAQIELIPTFTTWENYYDFVPKSIIKEVIDKRIRDILGETCWEGNTPQQLYKRQQDLENLKEELLEKGNK